MAANFVKHSSEYMKLLRRVHAQPGICLSTADRTSLSARSPGTRVAKSKFWLGSRPFQIQADVHAAGSDRPSDGNDEPGPGAGRKQPADGKARQLGWDHHLNTFKQQATKCENLLLPFTTICPSSWKLYGLCQSKVVARILFLAHSQSKVLAIRTLEAIPGQNSSKFAKSQSNRLFCIPVIHT